MERVLSIEFHRLSGIYPPWVGGLRTHGDKKLLLGQSRYLVSIPIILPRNIWCYFYHFYYHNFNHFTAIKWYNLFTKVIFHWGIVDQIHWLFSR